MAGNIGIVFDKTMSSDKHVNSVCKSALFHLINIAKIRNYLTIESTKALVHSFVTCRLDNCDSLLVGSPKYLTQKLQRIQSCAARLVSKQPRAMHVSPVLKELHWLPLDQRVIFKVLKFYYCHIRLSTILPLFIYVNYSFGIIHQEVQFGQVLSIFYKYRKQV